MFKRFLRRVVPDSSGDGTSHSQPPKRVRDFVKIEAEVKNGKCDIAIENHHKSGEDYLRDRRYKEEIDVFTQVIDRDRKHDRAYARRGLAYLELKQYDKALADFNKAIMLCEDNLFALELRAITYQKMGKYEEALVDLNQVLKLGKNNIFALELRGIIYQKMGKYEEALVDFERAIEECRRLSNYSPYYSSECVHVEERIDDIESTLPGPCAIKTTRQGLSKLGINIKRNATEKKIAKLMKHDARGTYPQNIQKAYRHYGFDYRYIRGKIVTIDEIKHITGKNHVIEVGLYISGFSHSVLIEKIEETKNGDDVIIYDPYNNKQVRLPYQELKKVLTNGYTRPSEEQLKTREPLLKARMVEKRLRRKKLTELDIKKCLGLEKTSIDSTDYIDSINYVKGKISKKLSRKDRIYLYAYYADKLKRRIQPNMRDLKRWKHPKAKDFSDRYEKIEGKIKSALKEALKGKDSIFQRYARLSPAFHEKRETGEKELIESIQSLEALVNECQKLGVEKIHAERSGHVDQSDRALGGEQSDGLVRPSRLSFWERERLRKERQTKEEGLKSWIKSENRPAFKIVREDDLLFELQAELQTAAALGMNPVHVNDPDFGRWASMGLMKWVVTKKGELLFAPHMVEGVEIVHTMLTNGYDVVAAGEAKIELGENGYICREITNRSDLYQPDERSLEVGRRAFEAFGIQCEEEERWYGEGNRGVNRSDATALRVFANLHPEDLAAELDTAEMLGIKPMHVDDPDFGRVAKEGPIKWVVTKKGELLFAPSMVAHTVLTNGDEVFAAGEALMTVDGNEWTCVQITTNSDHYRCDDQSLEVGRQVFETFGIRFAEEERQRDGGHGEGKTREDGDDPVIQQKTRNHAERSGHVDQSDRALGGEQSDGLVRPSRLSFWERERLRKERQTKEEGLKSWIKSENRPAFKIVREDDLLFELQAELQTAETLGVNPVHVNDPGFGRWASVGLMKWVVTPEGELLFAPQTVKGVEIVHTMLTDGYDVVAAGEAKIAFGESGYVCREITNRSDLYQPDERSLEVARRAFEAFGIAFEEEGQRARRQTDGNGGENGDGDRSGHDERQSSYGGGERSGSGGGNGDVPQGRYAESSSSSDEESEGL